MKIEELLRDNVRKMAAYSSARDEFEGEAQVFLDANENPYPSKVNRYPDPYQSELKQKISEIKGLPTSQMLIGNGSDEVLDLLFRAFCNPGKDNIIISSPTYGMYKVLAELNDVAIKDVPLNANFELQADAILAEADENTKLIFVCSPNNPSGNVFNTTEIEKLVKQSNCIVVMDEAYIDFTEDESWINSLSNCSNLVVTQTFSKAWGMAGLRLGLAFSSEEIIGVLNKIKPPYNINFLSQEYALEKVKDLASFQKELQVVLEERTWLKNELEKIELVKHIYPSDANFWLVRVEDANSVYQKLMDKGVIVRNRSTQLHCDNCLRITVGTPEENKRLITELKAL